MTYDADVGTALRKTSVGLLHDNFKTQVRFLQASHVASGNPPPYDNRTWHLDVLKAFHSNGCLFNVPHAIFSGLTF